MNATRERQNGTTWRAAPRVAWDFWKAYAEKIGHYQTAAILALIYCVIVGPIWLVGRVMGHRFLPTFPAKASTFWHHASMGRASLHEMKKQG